MVAKCMCATAIRCVFLPQKNERLTVSHAINCNALPLDHYALRVVDRDAALNSLLQAGYSVSDDFELVLEDGSRAQSYALTHPTNPEVFVSSGPPGSKIDRWVKARGGRGAVHHVAYAVEDVEATMKAWSEGGVQFDRETPLVCPCDKPLVQVFTKEDPATGLVYELITRNGHPGFCKENVRRLMSGSDE